MKLEKLKKEINIGMNDLFAHISSLTGHIRLRLDDLRCTIAKSIVDYKAQPNCHLSFVICQLKKRRQLKTLFVILILSLVSCRDENEPMPVTREAGDGPVRFSYTLSGAGVTTRFMTTEAGGDFTANDRVGIFMLEHKTANDEGVWDDPYWSETRNIRYKTDAEKNLLPVSTSIRYPDDGSPVNFVSYYPYTPNITQKYKIPVDVSTYTGPLADMGLLVYDGRGVSKQTGEEATFAYKPQLCKLIIVVKPEDGYEDVDLTDDPGLTVRGLPTKAMYNLHLSAMEIPADKTLAGTDVDVSLTPVVTSNKDSVRWEALILPHTPTHAAAAGRFFTFTLGGSPYEYKLESETFEKGKKYRYDFTLLEPQTTVPDGMTNSYMVTPGESVTFPVSRAYNSTNKVFAQTLRAGAVGTWPHTFTTEVLWDDNGVISGTPTVSGSGNTAEVTVRTTSNHGNAVVAIKVNGTIVWSYHIWVTDYDPEVAANTFTANSGYVFMNRNLGATHYNLTDGVKTFGLLYQWGRKDPFPGSYTGSAGWTSNGSVDSGFKGLGSAAAIGDATNAAAIVTSIKNPQTFYREHNTNYYDWLPVNDNTLWNTATSNKKTVYDPCPSGWRVPRFLDNTYDDAHSPWKDYASPYNTDTWGKWTSGTLTGGMTFGLNTSSKSDNAQYPGAGYRRYNNGSATNRGVNGRCWSASPYSSSSNNAANLYFAYDGGVNVYNNNARSYGFSVRCVRE